MKSARVLGIAAIMLFVFAAFAAGATPPVSVTVSVTGTPTPGATVTAKAVVTINDGSTLQSIKWTQTGGVSAALSNTATDTVTVVLPDRKALKKALLTAIEEQPIADANLPSNIPSPSGYQAQLQSRFGVIGIVPEALAEAGGVSLDVAVTTSSGTVHTASSIAGTLPWTTTIGVRNVPIHLPVLLHGKDQATYNWTLATPAGSTAILADATTQNPEFTPDVAGEYDL